MTKTPDNYLKVTAIASEPIETPRGAVVTRRGRYVSPTATCWVFPFASRDRESVMRAASEASGIAHALRSAGHTPVLSVYRHGQFDHAKIGDFADA